MPQFYLTDLYAQTGLPIIHVRDYTIGTDNVVFDFGDGTTSINNGHVLWHQYNGAGPFTVSVSNISGTASQSQSISFLVLSHTINKTPVVRFAMVLLN
ncbi:MAG: hypothetical protein IPK08_07805 [Bacteroidetes bacterium]|nr:hypothetical protein [Bacteroidota bacterium]